MARDERIHNGQVVQQLSETISGGIGTLRYVPLLIIDVCQHDRWRERMVIGTGQIATFERFSDFIKTDPPEGLGTTVEDLEKLCRDNPTATGAIDKALQAEGKQGARNDLREPDNLVYNVHDVKRPAGNTQPAALRRLRKDRPDLHEQVIEGQMSAHAAMVAAGFRPKKFQVYSEDPERTARLLLKHMERATIEELQVWLDRLLSGGDR